MFHRFFSVSFICSAEYRLPRLSIYCIRIEMAFVMVQLQHTCGVCCVVRITRNGNLLWFSLLFVLFARVGLHTMVTLALLATSTSLRWHFLLNCNSETKRREEKWEGKMNDWPEGIIRTASTRWKAENDYYAISHTQTHTKSPVVAVPHDGN